MCQDPVINIIVALCIQNENNRSFFFDLGQHFFLCFHAFADRQKSRAAGSCIQVIVKALSVKAHIPGLFLHTVTFLHYSFIGSQIGNLICNHKTVSEHSMVQDGDFVHGKERIGNGIGVIKLGSIVHDKRCLSVRVSPHIRKLHIIYFMIDNKRQ